MFMPPMSSTVYRVTTTHRYKFDKSRTCKYEYHINGNVSKLNFSMFWFQFLQALL